MISLKATHDLVDNIENRTMNIQEIRDKIEDLLLELKECKKDCKIALWRARQKMLCLLLSFTIIGATSYGAVSSVNTIYEVNKDKNENINEENIKNYELRTAEQIIYLLLDTITIFLGSIGIFFSNYLYKKDKESYELEREDYLDKRELLLDLIINYREELNSNSALLNTLKIIVDNTKVLEEDEELLDAVKSLINSQKDNINFIRDKELKYNL